jgi:hypothetical protein
VGFVGFEIELDNVAGRRMRIGRRHLGVEQRPLGDLNRLIYKLGVLGLFDLVAMTTSALRYGVMASGRGESAF